MKGRLFCRDWGKTRCTHITKRQLQTLHDSPQPAHPLGDAQWTAGKPKGFWYEVDGSWRDWCRDQGMGWADGIYLYAVDLDALNILRLTTIEQVRAFHEEWAVSPIPDAPSVAHPNWAALATRYDGIEIAPYQAALRFHPLWYYSWDVASGCVWGNTHKVKLRLLDRVA